MTTAARTSQEQEFAVEYDTANIELTAGLEKSLNRAVEAIRRRCRDFPSLRLHIRLEQHPRKKDFRVGLNLQVAGRLLYGHGDGETFETAVRKARRGLEEQLEHLKAVLRREQYYKRKRQPVAGQPRDLKQLAAEAAKRANFAEFKSHLEHYWRQLARQIGREIATLEANKELPAGLLSARDIVDEVIAWAFENFDRHPEGVPLERWLYVRARRILDRRCREIWRERPLSEETPVSAEPTPQQPQPDLLADEADLLIDLLEPEPEPAPGEDLAVELPEPQPEEELSRRELRQALRHVLRGMPRLWREAVWLHYLEGYDPVEIAMIQGLSEQAVRKNIRQAVALIRAKLSETRDRQAEARSAAQSQ